MKLIFSIFFVTSVYASAFTEIKTAFPEGEYEVDKKTSSPNCPEGQLVFIEKEVDKAPLQILLFAEQIDFELSSIGKEVTEAVPESCLYKTKIENQKDSITKTVVRSSCPSKDENGTLVSKLIKTKDGLSYESLNNGRSITKCHYKPALAEVRSK